jgi:hypothetical protein
MKTLENCSALHQVPTNLLWFPFPRLVRYTVIINTDIDTEAGIHWDAVHLEETSSIGCYLYSYALFPLVPAIRDSLQRVCTLWSYNTRTLHCFTTNVCGQYSCLFALSTDRGLGPRQFVDMFGTTEPDRQAETFMRELGQQKQHASGGIRCGQCCTCAKGNSFFPDREEGRGDKCKCVGPYFV